ncbi:MAG: hypothetical protein CMI80_00340 [Candidatus Pelagibacter sp.]|nr:hypothetical protein [Candidatus Pelagibacter sp.]|tara:strand:+ start:1681 stop:2139 length:459 start_codon:yes stop_codon:yes gene_type:complete
MKNKSTVLIFIFFILSNCAFEPIYSSKKVDFDIIKIESAKKDRLNSTIKKYLKNTSNNESVNKYRIKIDANKNKIISSKDKKGNAQVLTMIISVKIEIYKMDSLINTKNFSEQFIYSNNSNKFDLSKYEKNIEKNLTNKILSNITLFMLTLK